MGSIHLDGKSLEHPLSARKSVLIFFSVNPHFTCGQDYGCGGRNVPFEFGDYIELKRTDSK